MNSAQADNPVIKLLILAFPNRLELSSENTEA